MECIDNDETAKEIKSKYIQCENPDYRRGVFVCKHLNFKNKVGFHEAFETFKNMKPWEDDDIRPSVTDVKLTDRKRGNGTTGLWRLLV